MSYNDILIGYTIYVYLIVFTGAVLIVNLQAFTNAGRLSSGGTKLSRIEE